MRDAVAMATAAQPSVGCFVTPGDLWQHRGGSHGSVAADTADITDAEAWGGLERFGPSNQELSSLLLVRLVAAPNGLTRVYAYGLNAAAGARARAARRAAWARVAAAVRAAAAICELWVRPGDAQPDEVAWRLLLAVAGSDATTTDGGVGADEAGEEEEEEGEGEEEEEGEEEDDDEEDLDADEIDAMGGALP